MVYFIEIWNAKPAWHALSTQERGEYMTNVGAAIQGLLEKGVKVLTWSNNDPATSYRADFDYFAIWTFPDQDSADAFQGLVEGAGWYNYFEQSNLMGKEATAEDIIGQLVQL
ncbi:MAG: DUF6616 family protein [Bacteroidota bacterium]